MSDSRRVGINCLEALDTAGTTAAIANAMMEHRPCSMACLSDGEGALLWAGAGFQTWHYLAHHGIAAGEQRLTAEQMVSAIGRLNLVGMPRSGHLAKRPDFRPKLEAGFDLWGIDFDLSAREVDSMACFYMIFDFWLWGLIQGRNVVIVNNDANGLKAALEADGLPKQLAPHVPPRTCGWAPAAILPITLGPGLAGSQQALDDLASSGFKPDIALLGAGSRVVHLCVEIAERYTIPALDLGCVCSELHDYECKQPGGWDTMLKYYQEEG